MRLLRSLLICLGIAVTITSIALGQAPYVTGFDPICNACNGPAHDWLKVQFSTRMDLASIIDISNTSIHASYSGYHNRAGYGYTGFPTTGRYEIYPSGAFFPGERVAIALKDGLMSETAVPLNHGYIWSFTVATSGGSGVFDSLQDINVANDPHPLEVADLDGNGTLDLIVGHRQGGSISIYYGNPDGTFSAGPTTMVGSGPLAICATDLNGDIWVDLVIANRYSNNLAILMNNGDGTFTTTINSSVGSAPFSLAARFTSRAKVKEIKGLEEAYWNTPHKKFRRLIPKSRTPKDHG